jgi:hypothetical protein
MSFAPSDVLRLRVMRGDARLEMLK